MCDFPNVENNDLELEALGGFYDVWEQRIRRLRELSGTGFRDESLVLCCCYIRFFGRLFFGDGPCDREVFTRALLLSGGNDLFRRINPHRLLRVLEREGGAQMSSETLESLRRVLGDLRDEYYPWEQVSSGCRSVLTEEEFALIAPLLWKGALASEVYDLVEFEGAGDSFWPLSDGGEATLNLEICYAGLELVFARSRTALLSGKLRKYRA